MIDSSPRLTPEIEKTLCRYLEIQSEERSLAEEKRELQNRLAAHLERFPGKYWYPIIADRQLKVRCETTTTVDYDEERLSTRLGDRYRSLLKPDIKKIRKHLDSISAYLEPVLEKIGSPDRNKVRDALERGVVRKDEFAGAFEKKQKTRIAVMLAKPEEPSQNFAAGKASTMGGDAENYG